MLTKQDYENLAAILSVAKFDNLTIPAAAIGVVLLNKIQTLAAKQEENGSNDSASNPESSSDESA